MPTNEKNPASEAPNHQHDQHDQSNTCGLCSIVGESHAPHPDEHSPKLERASHTFNLWLTYAQAAALCAIALAAVGGIGQAIYEMIAARDISLGDLLMLFLYVEILSMVKGASLGTREIPIHTPIALAIVAVSRYIVVDVEHITAVTTLCTAAAILLLVFALWLIQKTGRKITAS